MKSMKPKNQNKGAGIKGSFRPAEIGISAPRLDMMGGASNAPAAKQVRKMNRAGIVGRRIKVGSGKY